MNWLVENWTELFHSLISSIIIIIAVMVVTRLNGLRSFAKITPIDFAVTVSIGSIISSTIMSSSNSILKGVFVIAVLIILQTLFGWFKAKFIWFDKALFNQPLFLMRDGEFLDKNIDSTKISRENIIAKLRENNVAKLDNVRAVILETTGDISVITGEDKIDEYIISDVRHSQDEGNKELKDVNNRELI